MARILAFDSMYIVNPVRRVYVALVGNILNKKNLKKSTVVLYRLDPNNAFISDNRNISGISLEAQRDHIDAMSMKFYQYLEKFGCQDVLSIDNIPLYELYTRQVRLKLSGVLRCALRIKKLSIENEDNIEIITDKQTISIMTEAFLFLDYTPNNIKWRVSGVLTVCISINSLIMRSAAILRMYFSSSKLPKKYYYKHVNSSAPTVLITMPIRRPEAFFSMYVKKFNSSFNIVLYSMGVLHDTPNDYKCIKVRRSKSIFRGKFNTNLCCGIDSYIVDIILIYKGHANLSVSIDIVDAIFVNNIDAVVSRLQTSVVDNQLVNEARRRGIFILCDVFEEVYYCDSAIISSNSRNTKLMKLALTDNSKVIYKGNNSLIDYRLKDWNNNNNFYLHELLGVDKESKIVFYASDPLKEESQRYLTEKFLIKHFSSMKKNVFVIKTHPQDNGKVTNYAYHNAGSPSNVMLVGDVAQRSKIISKSFAIFDDFDFNAAIASSDGFLTTSSSSILQALVLNIKAGVVDIFNNGYYDYLVNYKAILLINSEESLQYFLKSKKLNVSENTLSYCGLKNKDEEFDVGGYLLECLEKIK
jgi:hypothetical protein